MAAEHRPRWMRVDRLLGEHGIKEDTAAGREEFEQRMEARRGQEDDGQEWVPVRRGWCYGSEEFRREMLARAEGGLGEHHAGELRREAAEGKAERIIAEELERLGWTVGELEHRPKGDPGKLAVAARLRRETTLPLKWIATRLKLGTWRSAGPRLRKWKNNQTKNDDP